LRSCWQARSSESKGVVCCAKGRKGRRAKLGTQRRQERMTVMKSRSSEVWKKSSHVGDASI
jgi:hypothetical protein